MELDFSKLYSLLELEPGCSLEELRYTYRKRVAELHPDRHASPETGDGSSQLSTLTSLYRMAIQFHDVHGRLPGTASGEPVAPRANGALIRTPPDTLGDAGRKRPAQIPASHWCLLAALAGLVAYLLWHAPPETSPPIQAPAVQPPIDRP